MIAGDARVNHYASVLVGVTACDFETYLTAPDLLVEALKVTDL